jgi:hypothetical protein
MARESNETPGDSFVELPEIWQPEAAAIAEIFAQLPPAVGVPGVHLFWRLLANFPEVLQRVWFPLAAVLKSRALAQAAAGLRRDAFIEEAVGMPSHKAFRGDLVRAEIDADFRDKISNFNDLSQYGLSRLLVLVSALLAPPSADAARDVTPASPAPAAPDPVYVPPLRAAEARGKAVEVLERTRAEHGSVLLDDYYRSLARIPDYLAAAWNAIRPLVGDPEYQARAAALVENATAAAARVPAPLDLSGEFGTFSEPRRSQLRGLITYFGQVLLPQTLIDVTLIKALTEGPERATRTPFDITA